MTKKLTIVINLAWETKLIILFYRDKIQACIKSDTQFSIECITTTELFKHQPISDWFLIKKLLPFDKQGKLLKS